MKLKVTKGEQSNHIPGLQATVVRNDAKGAVLVIESGYSVMNIQISDLLEVIEEQEQQAAKAPETTANTEPNEQK